MAQHSAPTPPSRRRRRASAVAASGVLLGVAAVGLTTTNVVATLRDPVFGGTTFTAANNGFEISGDGSTWRSGTSASDAVTMTATPAAAMLPGTTVYTAVSLRTKTGSSAINVATKATTTATGLPNRLLYAVVRSNTCTSSAFTDPGSFLVGGVTTDVPISTAPTDFPLQAATATAPGPTASLCFRLRLPDTIQVWTDSSVPGSGPPVWNFEGKKP
ncbi:hypothetical protein [Rhodococcoides corynebacterioides]|uniref:Ribosomally synthesized peptide with SipW-like signal peptide n=1 Tax=Rhodococcoides corynebacterioides TaxID=53972 RepID=A0ABS7P5A6_9NOCA|nr:hypothetical protein [Rhodococcus corynebacterioides]MBY6367588.1 hypothetical protein [Rhodococcus corynebacterioides]MBY6407818.1 hypothetical protein [Rhodococcus corynebacterioides]